MYAIKLELKLNNKERAKLAGCAGFKRVVYNFGLDLLKQSWQLEGIKASDGKRIALRVRRLPTEGDPPAAPDSQLSKRF